jgi:hypothetical protein
MLKQRAAAKAAREERLEGGQVFGGEGEGEGGVKVDWSPAPRVGGRRKGKAGGGSSAAAVVFQVSGMFLGGNWGICVLLFVVLLWWWRIVGHAFGVWLIWPTSPIHTYMHTHTRSQPPSLAEACLGLLLQHVDAIEALGDVSTQVTRDRERETGKDWLIDWLVDRLI